MFIIKSFNYFRKSPTFRCRKMLSYCIFTAFIVLAHALQDNRPVVETSMGRIKGHYKTSHDGRTFSAFEGIPYAKPPIGDLRFQPPQQSGPWTGMWNAITLQQCAQVNMFSVFSLAEWIGNEDCLYLNVYVPTDNNNENLDVLVHVHGGGFTYGTNELGGPELLMDRNIVYVSITYRLGVLGFLCTEDDSVSGNNGMKDQLLALKWIKSHIHNFRGNPNSVTLMGTSTGAATVHLHYFSPLAKDLFHRGISNSGTALAPGTIQEAPLAMAKKLAKHVGCPTASTKELVQCLKQRPVGDILKYSNSLFSFRNLPFFSFAPVVEKTGEGAYLTDYPFNLLVRGKVHDLPWICSFTSAEGTSGSLILSDRLEELREQRNTLMPLLLEYWNTVDVKYQDEVTAKIKQFYYGDEMNNNNSTLIKMYGDRFYYLNIELATRIQAKVNKSPVYSYMFAYIGERVPEAFMQGTNQRDGVCHGEDGYYYYNSSFAGMIFNKEKLTEKDGQIKDLMLGIITSFANDGRPTIQHFNWNPFNGDSEDFHYLLMNNDGIKMDVKKELAPTQFWRSLPIQENESMNRVNKDEL